MNTADLKMVESETDAQRATSGASHPRLSREIERIPTASSTSSSSSGGTQNLERRHTGVSRVSTQGDLERNPTVLSRIQTAKSQHDRTVGRSATAKSRESRRPLPEMGLGKPYPPPLPDRDEYVVEFDGPDDPIHAQNWPFKKKCVLIICSIPYKSQY